MSPAAPGGFTLHPEAARELTQLWEYLADRNVEAAGRVRAEILEAIRAVVPYPHSGHRRPDLTARPLRFLVVRDYLIAYAPDTRPLVVLAVLHGRRNPRTLAAILSGRQEPRSTGGA
jgi:plasmid stabilization system protein ParE